MVEAKDGNRTRTWNQSRQIMNQIMNETDNESTWLAANSEQTGCVRTQSIGEETKEWPWSVLFSDRSTSECPGKEKKSVCVCVCLMSARSSKFLPHECNPSHHWLIFVAKPPCLSDVTSAFLIVADRDARLLSFLVRKTTRIRTKLFRAVFRGDVRR